jgi:energy-coupling factor transport system ATP-binding protein
MLYDQPGIGDWLPMPQVIEIARRLGVRKKLENSGYGDPLTVAELKEGLEHGLVPQRYQVVGRTLQQQSQSLSGSKPVIELKQVMFRYKKQEDDELTIKPVDLRIGKGEFTAIIGHNGAGKSTLCKLITGLLKPQSGEVLIHNKSVASYRADQRVRHVGFVFQNPDFQFVSRTVYDEVAYGLRIQKLNTTEIDKRVKHVTKLLHIDNYLQEHPHFLSRGERRRVAIASILALEPEVIILDEPTTGLDTTRCREMMDYIRTLWEQGHTIVLLTHDMRVVADYVPRTIVMSDGKIHWDGLTRHIFAKREELHRHNITLPPVVELSYALGWSTPALTSEEFIARIQDEYEENSAVGGFR